MKVSYAWLKEYLGESLPPPSELEELVTFHSFEIEGVDDVNGDVVIDVDVLPNRSSDCLSHIGIAREIATIIKRTLRKDPLRTPLAKIKPTNELVVNIEEPKLCTRFSAVVVKGVKVGPSPAWLKERLEALGQKSINNIVDATNYVMFDLGQPLHAFDAGKIEKNGDSWNITVRLSKKGEKITTLDGASHELNENLLITDGASGTPLGIAGVKGGKVAEVDENTTDIILEAAHFDPVHTRKTSRGLKLRTDASLRFENNPSAELTLYALEEVTKIILDISGGTYIGTIDIYGAPQEGVEVSVTVDEVNKLLGTSLTEKQVEEILKQLGFEYTSSGGNFTVKSPFERTDLHITEDLIEEIGRVYGYRNIEAQSLPKLERALEMNKAFFYGEKVRNALVESGFSEVYTYTLFDKGEIELANPLASDKGVMRPSLARGLGDSLVLNSNNAALLGLSLIKIFELGIVFTKEGENTELGIGILPLNTKKVESASKDIFSSLQKVMSDALGTSVEGELKDGIFTINFNELIKDLREPKEYEPLRVGGSEAKYKPISQYPFALRDIAVWTSEGTKPEDVLTIVKEKAGELLLNHSLFDQFEKEGKISYAFHLVFQSYEKTLSEKEINDVMESMTSALNKKEGWEVR